MSRDANIAAQKHLAELINTGHIDALDEVLAKNLISARGVQIARFQDGKIVERWGRSDELGIMKQLGATRR